MASISANRVVSFSERCSASSVISPAHNLLSNSSWSGELAMDDQASKNNRALPPSLAPSIARHRASSNDLR